MPGLMNFLEYLEPFATGYLETKIAGQEKRAEAIQKQNELSDAKLAAIAKNRAIQLDNDEIEADRLEAIRAKEEENLLKQHSDMNPTVLKYLKDQNYFYDKAAWTAFSEGFKTEAGGSDKWYQQNIIGGDSWEDMMAERIEKTFNKEDAKNTSDLAENTKNLLLDFNVTDQPYSLLNPKILNPTAILEYKTSTQALKTAELDFDIKTLTHDITEETKEDTIALLSANLSGKELSNEHQTIINNIAEKTQSSEISIRNTFEKLQKTKLKMVTWDYVNQATIGGLDINIKRQNEELNKLAIEAAVYDAETQPAKDLIDNNLKQADLLSKNITNSSLRQKNTLTIKQLQTNIDNVEQGMSIAEASKDSNLQKLKLTVKNLEIENEMDALMLQNQPQETVLRLQKMQLDITAQQIENGTAEEIDVATLENIRQRNIQLEKNIGSFDENQKTDLEEQNLRIEKLQKELAEGPTVKMPTDAYIQKTVTDSINTAIGAPQKGTGVYGMIWDMESMSSPFIKTLTKSATDETNTRIKTMMSEMANNPNSPLYGRDPNAIDYNNISKRILGKKLSAQYYKSITDAVETISASYIANTDFDSLNDQQIDNITTMVFHLHKNEPATIKINGKNVQLSVDQINKRLIDTYKMDTGVFAIKSQSGELVPSNENQFNSSMLDIINQYDKGKGFKEENDIPPLPQK